MLLLNIGFWLNVSLLLTASSVNKERNQTSISWYIGGHYRKSHSTMKADITFNIIQRKEHDELRLRIVEAYEIKTRRPTLNRKQEDLGTGFLA